MARLTIKNSDGTYSQPTDTTFEKVFNKLAQFEDILEKYDLKVEELDKLIDGMKSTISVLLDRNKNTKQDRDTWKRACELACKDYLDFYCCDYCGGIGEVCENCSAKNEYNADYYYEKANEQFICDKCKELEGKHILPDMHLIMDKYDKNDIFVPTLDDISPKLEQVDENNDKDNDNDCNDKIWEQFKLIEDKCDKTPIKPIELIVDGTQYSFKCGEIDTNRNYFEVARNPNKCPICDKEYTDSEFICAIEHGTIQLKNICVDCYNKIFNRNG